MKILWIAPIPSPDGDAHLLHPAPWILTLLESLHEVNEVELFVLSTHNKASITFKRNSITFIFLQMPSAKFDLLSLFLIRILKMIVWLRINKSRFDLIHVHGTEHQYEIAAFFSGLPVVVSIQGFLTACLPYWKKWTKNAAYRKVGSIYEMIGIRLSKNFLGRTDWDYNWIRRINKRANYYYGRELIRSEFYFDCVYKKDGYIAFVGGNNELKGLDFVFDLVNELHSQKIFIPLKIIGRCTEQWFEKIKKSDRLLSIDWTLIESCGVLNAVEMADIFSQSLCLVHPSHIDNSPNSICEAQVCGLPVLATPVGGVPSLIDHMYSGFLIERSIAKYVSQILELRVDPDLWHFISKNQKIIARSRHNRDKGIEELLQLYKKMI